MDRYWPFQKQNALAEAMLQNANYQAEELKAQEEELRQNLEEMKATQDEMSRREK
ncbi:MAG: hypothetical protein HC905_20400 [Bacteroidales bacterium]|nr:hypothetical protein [Bacteroidales bacterium]